MSGYPQPARSSAGHGARQASDRPSSVPRSRWGVARAPPGPRSGWAPSSGPLTADVVPVGVVHLLDPPVAEGQLPHPVHAAVDAGAQAQVGSRGRTVEAIGGEVVGAGEAEGAGGRRGSVNGGGGPRNRGWGSGAHSPRVCKVPCVSGSSRTAGFSASRRIGAPFALA